MGRGELFEYLSKLEDLVVIMDESHHYRAKAGFNAINVIFAEEIEQMEIIYSQAKMNLPSIVTCGEFLERKEYYSVEKNERQKN